MTTVIILLPQKLPANLQKLKPLLVLQHHQKPQVELVNNQLVVVTQHQHQHRPVGVQLQMFTTLHQVIVTTLQTVQTTHLHHVRQLV